MGRVGRCSTWNISLFSSLSCVCASLFTRAPCCRSDHRSHLPFRRASLRWASFLGWISSATKIRVSCVGGGGCGARGLFRCLFYVERVCVLVLSPCRCLCVVACVSRGMEGCGEWLLARARTIILRLLHRALSSIKVLRYRVPSSPICPLRRDT